MRIFYIRTEPLVAEGSPATAFVVAEDADEAILLLRKDINFSGYRLPPAELTPYAATNDEVRRVLGDAAAHEKGVYGFTVLGPGAPEKAGTPPQALS